MSGLGIDYPPPIENLPIFDSEVFAQATTNPTSDPTKLNFPTAQGAETFPSGLTTTSLTTPSVNLSSSINQEPIGYTITAYPPPLTTLSNTPSVDSNANIYNLGVSLQVGGKYLVFGSITIEGSNGANTGTGFSNFLVFNIVGTQQSDWFSTISSVSQQNYTTSTNYNSLSTNFSYITYIDPATFPFQNTTNVYINTAGWTAGNNPTGVWKYTNLGTSYITFVRIA